MSTNKTQNYNLHSWVPEDDFLRSEFNDNFTSLDTALKTLSDGLTAETSAREQAVSGEAAARTAAVNAEKTAREQAVAAEATARQNAVNAEINARKQAVTAETTARTNAINALTVGKAEVVIGSYTGNSTVPRTINLGFQPKAVLLIKADGSVYNYNAGFGGLFFPGHPIKYGGYSSAAVFLVETTSNGFRINVEDTSYSYNTTDRDYYYIAFK